MNLHNAGDMNDQCRLFVGNPLAGEYSKLLSSMHPTATEGYDTDATLPALAIHTPSQQAAPLRRMACSTHKCIACASNCSYKTHVRMCTASSCFEGKQCISGAPSDAPKQGRM